MRTTILTISILFFLGCKKEIPDDKQEYIGVWTYDSTLPGGFLEIDTLEIHRDRTATYIEGQLLSKRHKKGKIKFKDNKLIIKRKYLFVKLSDIEFIINTPPTLDTIGYYMVLDDKTWHRK